MRDLLLLVVHLFVTLARLARPGGVRSVVAESLLLKHQLIISGRSRRRAPVIRNNSIGRRFRYPDLIGDHCGMIDRWGRRSRF